MGYDVHIVRTENWLDANEMPITKSDVEALITSDAELSWSTTDYVDMSDDEDTFIARYFMICWNGNSCFWWYKNEVRCSMPEEEQIVKMVKMARLLNANVIGDDGEKYHIEQESSGKENLITLPE